MGRDLKKQNVLFIVPSYTQGVAQHQGDLNKHF